MASLLGDYLWSEKFWLPKDATWKDFESNDPSIYYPNVNDIFLPSILAGFALLLFRYVNERLIVIPVAKYLGVKVRKPYNLKPNSTLETAYKNKAKSEDGKVVKELSKKTSLSEREVARWLRKRCQKDTPSAMQKFTECSWHFIFYTTMFIYGMVVLWDKSWFWETRQCWVNWPKQHVDRDIYWYYLLELGFYWSLTFTLLIDHKRKDFTEMVVHHIVTILLVYFSFVVNFIRVGTLVLVVHDAVDYWMAAAKMAKYSKRQTACEIFFGVFVVVWILTRLIVYPFRVLYTAVVESYQELSFFYSHFFFNILLIILQILHIIWSYMIFRILLQKLNEGAVKKDVRSDSESQESSEEENYSDKKDTKETFSSRVTRRSNLQMNGSM